MKSAGRGETGSKSSLAMCVGFAFALSGCVLPHSVRGEVDTGPVIDEQFADRIVLADSDVLVAPDTMDTPIVPPDVIDDDANDAELPDVPPPIDVPDVPDVPPPVDIPVPIDVPPDRIVAIDVPPPMDVPPPRDVPPPMDVPMSTPAGSPCSAMTTCEPGSQCFTYGVGGSYCADCGGYGDRPCAGAMCREGSYDAQSDSCIHAVGTHAGEPGGSCSRSSDCGSLGQCVNVAGYMGRACLRCGDVGEACCCPSGTLGSCACNTGATCTAVAGTYWTVCH